MSFTVTFQTYRDCGWIAMFGLANKSLSCFLKKKFSKSLLSEDLGEKNQRWTLGLRKKIVKVKLGFLLRYLLKSLS